jgi:hypothetical protein
MIGTNAITKITREILGCPSQNSGRNIKRPKQAKKGKALGRTFAGLIVVG